MRQENTKRIQLWPSVVHEGGKEAGLFDGVPCGVKVTRFYASAYEGTMTQATRSNDSMELPRCKSSNRKRLKR